MCDGDQGRRKAYKDILFKMTKNETHGEAS